MIFDINGDVVGHQVTSQPQVKHNSTIQLPPPPQPWSRSTRDTWEHRRDGLAGPILQNGMLFQLLLIFLFFFVIFSLFHVIWCVWKPLKHRRDRQGCLSLQIVSYFDFYSLFFIIFRDFSCFFMHFDAFWRVWKPLKHKGCPTLQIVSYFDFCSLLFGSFSRF